MADRRFNILLILPFQERWRVRERIKRGQPIYGGGSWAVRVDDNEQGATKEVPPSLSLDAIILAAFASLDLPATATIDDVKKRFKELAMRHHPDRGGDAAKFKEVLDAKNRLLKHLEAKAVVE